MKVRSALVCAVMTLSLWAESGTSNAETEAVIKEIEAALPTSWKIVERKSESLPMGHYWGQQYSGIRGEEVILQGDSDVHVLWLDAKGQWHKDAVAKEVLKIYIMPSTYRESLLRFFVPKRPAGASLLVEARSFKFYAYPFFRITDNGKFTEIEKNLKSIRWPDSPANTGSLSWSNWKSDLNQLLDEK